ncbi:MAG TPA: PsiF repeat-containing protein [Beijerinckia sp.]|jgi:hypothetical protein|nr:PsiF repeat-containing protein [Beijerinckia sp.]
MKISAVLTIATLLCAGPVLAQTQAPASPAAPSTPVAKTQAPVASTTPAKTTDARPQAKEVRAECKDEIRTQGLKGQAGKQAVSDCVVKERPDLAAQEQCRTDPKTKGMDKEAREAFVKDCVKHKS